jgi:hypothetical protein
MPTTTPNPTGGPGNARALQDALKVVSITLPNAANQVNSNSIDLEQVAPFPTTERVGVRLAWTTALGANNLNINFVFQESAESAANFTNVAMVPNPAKVLASLNTVYSAGSIDIPLPVATKRYIRFFAKGEANGGNASNGTASMALLF